MNCSVIISSRMNSVQQWSRSGSAFWVRHLMMERCPGSTFVDALFPASQRHFCRPNLQLPVALRLHPPTLPFTQLTWKLRLRKIASAGLSLPQFGPAFLAHVAKPIPTAGQFTLPLSTAFLGGWEMATAFPVLRRPLVLIHISQTVSLTSISVHTVQRIWDTQPSDSWQFFSTHCFLLFPFRIENCCCSLNYRLLSELNAMNSSMPAATTPRNLWVRPFLLSLVWNTEIFQWGFFCCLPPCRALWWCFAVLFPESCPWAV